MADRSHSLIDDKLEAMERHLSAIYSRANKEVTKKSKQYFDKFKSMDDQKRKLVDAGKLSNDEYKRWRQNKIMYGKKFSQMKKDIANQMLNVNKTATAYVNGKLPEMYSIGYNALENTVDGIGGYSFTLTDPNTVKNLATKDKTLLPYKTVNGKKDVRWNTKKVNAEILQGILQGDSIPKISKRLGNVTEMNRTSAIRNARTSVTSAENWGRIKSYEKAQEDGVELVKEWVSTNDDRTRETHALMNGETVPIDEPFSNGLMYPADPSGEPAEVYNCRCTMIVKVKGFKKV